MRYLRYRYGLNHRQAYNLLKLEPLQRQWLIALLQQRYPKGIGKLENTSHELCCLGVACRITETFNIPINVTDLGILEGCDLSHQLDTTRAIKLRTHTGLPIPSTGLTSLISLNDYTGCTHPEIAKHVLTNPYNYFTQ